MDSTPHSSQDWNHSSGFQDTDPNDYEHFLESQSEEEQAITASVDKLDESTYRSPSQESAIETLQDFEDSIVLELLSAMRLPNHVHYPYLEGLSSEQSDALSHLKFCPDGLVLLWLRSFRGQNRHYPELHTN